jgi:two-component system alkaline phosphatase synthesis response regulator PhoP
MIYCVEDDAGIRDIEVYTLNTTGFAAVGFPDSQSFFEALEKELPDLIILDIMLPGEDGIAVLKKLRQSPVTKDIPVIMATARGAEYDKIIGLDSGADDYLVKPFGMMEMVSRVRAVLRRSTPKKDPDSLSIGSLTMNTEEHTVTVNNERVDLTLKEYNILYSLLSHPGVVFTRDQLLTEIWGVDYDGETRTVDVHMRTLRQKLGICADIIETVRGVGYRLGVRI